MSPPLRSAKGDASAASRGMPVIHPNTPATSFPRTPFPPPSLREGGRERSEQGDARNSPQYTPPRHSRGRHFPPPSLREGGRERSEQGDARHSQHPTPKTESSACFPICTPIQNKALYQHIYGTSQLYFPLLLDSYRAVVLAFSLYKLVSDRRIWTPIKPKLDEGIQELR